MIDQLEAHRDTSHDGQRERVDRIVEDVVEIGRLWVHHGLTIGKLALRTSERSAARAADLLGNLAEELAGEDGRRGLPRSE